MIQAGIPAWKRLGLKLKNENQVPEQPNTNGTVFRDGHATVSSPKDSRRVSIEPPRKKQKTETNHHETSSGLLPSAKHSETRSGTKPMKRVSFSVDAKLSSSDAEPPATQGDTKTESSVVATKKPKKPKTSQPPGQLQKSNGALDYLAQYLTTRASWKFNKNREIWILKHAFSETDIPRDYDLALAKYIHGLQGAGARGRLELQCKDLLSKEVGDQDEVSGNPQQLDDKNHERRFRESLGQIVGPVSSIEHDNTHEREYQAWIHQTPRPRLLLWSLGLADDDLRPPSSTDGQASQATIPNSRTKKRKNRTAVVEYDSSSSSSSSSSSESDSGGDAEPDSKSELVMSKAGIRDETSSSGDSSDDDSDSDLS